MAKIRGYLTLIGDNFEHDIVTQTLKCAPVWNRKKTDILGNGSLFGHCEWGVATNCINADNFITICDSLMRLLPCTTDEMVSVAKKYNSEWHILFFLAIEHDYPAIIFPPEFIEFAASIGAQIGFDIYGCKENFITRLWSRLCNWGRACKHSSDKHSQGGAGGAGGDVACK